MIYAEILATGTGSRMGNTDLPKQFLSLADKPIFIHTLEQFIFNPKIDKIVVCVHKDWMTYAKDTIKKYISDTTKIDVVEGGSTRNESIINGCKHIKETYGINKEDIIITHDAVRPFVTQRIIDDNIEAASEYDAVDTVIPATDTIVESKDGTLITSIPIRSHYYQGQTPQTFNIEKLIKYYSELTEEEKEVLTDACKIFILKGEDVKLVNGDVSNIKITYLHDLKISNALVLERKNND